MYFSSFEAGNCVSNFQLQMTKNRTPTPVYLDPGMHPGLEVKGLKQLSLRTKLLLSFLPLTFLNIAI